MGGRYMNGAPENESFMDFNRTWAKRNTCGGRRSDITWNLKPTTNLVNPNFVVMIDLPNIADELRNVKELIPMQSWKWEAFSGYAMSSEKSTEEAAFTRMVTYSAHILYCTPHRVQLRFRMISTSPFDVFHFPRKMLTLRPSGKIVKLKFVCNFSFLKWQIVTLYTFAVADILRVCALARDIIPIKVGCLSLMHTAKRGDSIKG